MANAPEEKKLSDVPTQVFEEFLTAAAATDLPVEVVTRLRRALLEEKVFTEPALRAALFGEETNQ
jgi:hypothetical protein